MKAAVMQDIGRMVMEERPRPAIGAGEILVAVKATAICGSDVRTLWHGSSHVSPPRILGHEVAGVVIEVGKGVHAIEVGNAVAVTPAIGCGVCEYCRSDNTNMCAHLETLGFEFDGGFAEMMVVPEKAVKQGHVNRIPTDFPFEQAALAEPLACCINGQEFLSIGLGQNIAVIGAGAIGLFHAELALLKGVNLVFLADVTETRLKQASMLGSHVEVLNSNETDIVQEILARTNGSGVDVVIVACPVGAAQAQALHMVKKMGKVSLFGGLPPNQTNEFLDSNLIHYKEIGIFGAHASTASQNRLALGLLTGKKIDAGRYVTHTFSLDQIMDGMNAVKGGKALKAIVKP
jgi:L-iditol 2-dehydrogenase